MVVFIFLMFADLLFDTVNIPALVYFGLALVAMTTVND